MDLGPGVYIVTNPKHGTLYVGATTDLPRRIDEHKAGVVDGFTASYPLGRLVWFESHESVASALTRERALKRWHRAWKIRLIEERNPEWIDLSQTL